MKKKLDLNRSKVERLQSDGYFEEAAKLSYVEIPNLEKEIQKLEEKITSQDKTFRDTVTSNEIAEVISRATGIKLSKLMESEKTKLLNLDNYLKEKIKGQDKAVEVVSDAILRSKAGINDANRPIASFLFLGPTGVGKTALAKALAYNLFDSEKAMIRVDCSELAEKHSVSKLIGTTAGYVGYGDSNMLAEPVRRRPYSIVLFDEIEKAHPDALLILLQILDDGLLHDGKGQKINFKNTIIIMTSNIGASEILDGKPKEAEKELKKYLKPEFINRIDEVVTFNPISNDTIKEIISNNLNELRQRLLGENYDIFFDDEALIDKIAKEAYDPAFGARPIKRYIQKHIENFLAKEILNTTVKKSVPYLFYLDTKGKFGISEKGMLLD